MCFLIKAWRAMGFRIVVVRPTGDLLPHLGVANTADTITSVQSCPLRCGHIGLLRVFAQASRTNSQSSPKLILANLEIDCRRSSKNQKSQIHLRQQMFGTVVLD